MGMLEEQVVLKILDLSKRFYVYSDAIIRCLGGIIATKNDNHKLKPCAFYGRKLEFAIVNVTYIILKC